MKRDNFVLEKQAEPVPVIKLDGREFNATQARELVLAKEVQDLKKELRELEVMIKDHAKSGLVDMYVAGDTAIKFEKNKAYFESLGYRYKYSSFFGHFKHLVYIEWGK